MRASFVALAALSALGVFYVSVVPIEFIDISWEEAVARFRETLTSADTPLRRTDFALNVMMIVPLAFFLSGAWLVDRRGFIRSGFALVVTVVICMGVSLASELAQVALPGRVSSRYDVIAHAIGTVFGAGMWLIGGRPFTAWIRTYTDGNRNRNLVDLILQVYLGGLLLFSLLPFNLLISPEELFRKLENGRIRLIPFEGRTFTPGDLWELCFDVLVFIPIGVLSARVFRAAGQAPRRWPETLAIGGLIVTALEFMQLFIYSRVTEVTDLLTGLVGVLIGAVVMQRFADAAPAPLRRRSLVPALQWFGVATLYLGFVCIYLWSPLEPISDKSMIRARFDGYFGIPFRTITGGSQLDELTALLRKTLLFVPLGIPIVRIARHITSTVSGRALALTFGLGLLCSAAVGIELVQALFPPHTPDISDTILYLTGGGVGVFAWTAVERRLAKRETRRHTAL